MILKFITIYYVRNIELALYKNILLPRSGKIINYQIRKPKLFKLCAVLIQ